MSVGRPIEPAPRDVREHAARAQPEQRDRDREKREVVVHDDREDARQRELGHQERARRQSDGDELATGNGEGRGHHLAGASSLLRILLPCCCYARALLAGAIVWAAVIPLAAFAAARPAASPAGVRRSRSRSYSIGHVICHQLPVRSFHLWGAALPVCARCTGIYAGAAATARRRAWALAEPRNRRIRAAPARLLFAALVPTALTLVYEWTTGTMPAQLDPRARRLPHRHGRRLADCQREP